DREGGGAAEVPLLGGHARPGRQVHGAAPLRAAAEAGSRRRGESDREDQAGYVSAADLTDAARRPFTGRRVRFGDLSLQLVAGAAAAAAMVLVLLIAWKVIEGAWPSVDRFGLGLITKVAWNPVVGREIFGAGSFLFGTAITSLSALLLATPLAIG